MAAQRLEALKGQLALLREQKDEQGVQRAVDAFLELSEIQDTRAPAQLLIEQGQYALDATRFAEALTCFARAWLYAETKAERLASLLGMASGFESTGDWMRFRALRKLIQRTANELASEEGVSRYERELAILQRDLPLLSLKLGPQARLDFGGLLQQLGTIRRTGIKASYLPYSEHGGLLPYLALASTVTSTPIIDHRPERNPSWPVREVFAPPGTGISSAVLNLGWASGAQYLAMQVKNLSDAQGRWGLFKLVNHQLEMIQELRVTDLIASLPVDLDGDGRQEVYLGGGRVLFRLDLLPSGLFQLRVAHSETSQSNSDIRSIMAADLDGDGRLELVVGTGPWRAYNVRVFRADPSGGELKGVAQRRLGTCWGLAPLPLLDGRMAVVVTRYTSLPNTRAFPAETPMGYPQGTYLLALRGHELELVDHVPTPFHEALPRRVVSGDFDGDHRHELAVQVQLSHGILRAAAPDHSYLQLIRQRADGSLTQLLLPGLIPWQALNLDDDPASELIVLDGASQELWVLGAGSEPMPSRIEEGMPSSALSSEHSPSDAHAEEPLWAELAELDEYPDDVAFDDPMTRIAVLTSLGLSQAGMRELTVVAATSPDVEQLVETLSRSAALMKAGKNIHEAEVLYKLILKRAPHELAVLQGLRGIYQDLWNVEEELKVLRLLLAAPTLSLAERPALVERQRLLERLSQQERDALQLERGVDPRLRLAVPAQIQREPARRSLEVRIHAGQGDVVTVPLHWTGERLTVKTRLQVRRAEWGSMFRLGLRRKGDATDVLVGLGLHMRGGGDHLITTLSPLVYGNLVRPLWEQACDYPDGKFTFELCFALERDTGRVYIWANETGWAYEFDGPIVGEPDAFELVFTGDPRIPQGRGVLEASIERLTLDGGIFTQTPLDVQEQARHALSNGDYQAVQRLAELGNVDNPMLMDYLVYLSQCRSGAFDACRRSLKALLARVGQDESMLNWLLWDQLYTSPGLAFPTLVEVQGYEALRRLESMWGLLAHAHPSNLMVLLTVSTTPSDEDLKKLLPPKTSEQRTLILGAYVRRLRAWLLLRRYDLTIGHYEDVRMWGVQQLSSVTEPTARTAMLTQLMELERTMARAYAFKGLPNLVLKHLKEALRLSPTPRLVAEELAVLPELAGLLHEPDIQELLRLTTYHLPKQPMLKGLDE